MLRQFRDLPHALYTACMCAQMELAKQKIRVGSQTKSLTELSVPAIDWTALAAGMGVPGSLASTVTDFCQLFQNALLSDGPSLIEARLV